MRNGMTLRNAPLGDSGSRRNEKRGVAGRTATPLSMGTARSGAGWGEQARRAVLVVGVLRRHAGVRTRDAVLLTQPASQVDAPAAVATERHVRPFRPLPTHRPIADRAACLYHRTPFPPTWTFSLNCLIRRG